MCKGWSVEGGITHIIYVDVCVTDVSVALRHECVGHGDVQRFRDARVWAALAVRVAHVPVLR